MAAPSVVSAVVLAGASSVPCRAQVARSGGPSIAPELIHPELWRGHQLGRTPHDTVPTGWVELDHQLPGGGWPRQALTELLLKHPGVGEMRLLAPALSAIAQGHHGAPRSVMLFDPPATPCAWAMAQLGLPEQSLIVVHGREGPRGTAVRHLLTAADVLWALEQALRSGHAGAVLAWLPDRLRADALRRIQLAAQAHGGPVFLLRGLEERLKPSPAPLRLAVHPEGPDRLSAVVLKRRGPLLLRPLLLALPALTAVRRSHPGWTSVDAPLPALAASGSASELVSV